MTMSRRCLGSKRLVSVLLVLITQSFTKSHKAYFKTNPALIEKIGIDPGVYPDTGWIPACQGKKVYSGWFLALINAWSSNPY
jgi:hypothetical protein